MRQPVPFIRGAMETTMTLESLGNELAKLPADIIHSLVSSKLKKTADRICGSCLRCDGPLAIVELGSSGEDVVALLAVLNETVLRVGSLDFDLIDRVARRGDLRIDLRPLPITDSNFAQIRTSMNGQDNLRQRTLFSRPKVQSPVSIKFREDNHDQKPLFKALAGKASLSGRR
jgi:hypothetical protein